MEVVTDKFERYSTFNSGREMRRFVALFRAWPPAWPLPSGPLGRQRLRVNSAPRARPAQRDAQHC